MIVVGLTGGIGSGKSTVARLLADVFAVPVYVADSEAKRIMAESSLIRSRLEERFGELLYASGSLDRKRLASIIFNDREHLDYVNSIIHPEVEKDFQQWTQQYVHLPVVVLESAILFESGFQRITDRVMMVYTPMAERIARVVKRDGCCVDDVMARIKNQLADEQKAALSDYIVNNGERQALIPQVEKWMNSLSYR